MQRKILFTSQKRGEIQSLLNNKDLDNKSLLLDYNIRNELMTPDNHKHINRLNEDE